MAEIDIETKLSLSHRGRAVEALLAKLSLQPPIKLNLVTRLDLDGPNPRHQ